MLLGAMGFGFKYGVLLILSLEMDLYVGLVLIAFLLLVIPLFLLMIWLVSFVWILNRFYRPGSV